MNAQTYRKIVLDRLQDALRETFYDVFAARLEKRYKLDFLTGREAVAHYLVKKHGWTLDYCRSLKLDDLQTLLFGEVDFLHLPKELQEIYDEISDMLERFELPDGDAPEWPPKRGSFLRGVRKKKP
jgi:hypothetical protein